MAADAEPTPSPATLGASALPPPIQSLPHGVSGMPRRDEKGGKPTGPPRPKTDGNAGNGSTKTTPAAAVWAHVALLQPKTPWKALRDFGVNDAVSLDVWRINKLPPGLTAGASRSS